MLLWTPTDWAEETRLRIEYINWLVETNGLPCFRLINVNLIGLGPFSVSDVLKYFSETGILIMNSTAPSYTYKPRTFEEWRDLHENSIS